MVKQDYLIIIKSLLLAQSLDDIPEKDLQRLINHFDKLYQEAQE